MPLRDRRCDGSCHITAKGRLLIPAAATLGSLVMSSHAASRLENRPVLLILTVLHRVRLAWGISGVPYLLLALGRCGEVLSA